MIKVANAPCSWGVLEFGLEGDSYEYPQVLSEMRATGYTGTELGDWGFMPTDPKELKEVLAGQQLELVGGFVPVALSKAKNHEAGITKALQTAKLMAEASREAFIVLADDNGTNNNRTKKAGRIKASDGLTDSEWRTFADGVHRIASSVLDETGLKTVFHHHCAGYIETPDEIDRMLSLTAPDLVGLCFDTGHYRFGGGDPVEGLNKFGDRIKHVHFKDCHPGILNQSVIHKWDYFQSVGEGIFCELGQGEVDFSTILAQLNKSHYQDWIVVEQDILPGMGQPSESAQRNRDYLKAIGV
ncbi:MAG: TIM barrel protein [Balneolales bacterium]